MRENQNVLEDESVLETFHRLNAIVNELRNLGHKVDGDDFSHRFLRCLPLLFDTVGNLTSSQKRSPKLLESNL